MSTIIIYDSRYGFTQKCAEYIQEKVSGAKMFHVKDKYNIEDFTEVYLGCYIDDGKIHKAMRKYIERNRLLLMRKEVKLFCTCVDNDDFTSALQNSIHPELFYHAKYVCPGGEIKYDQLTNKEKKLLQKRINVDRSMYQFYPERLDKLIEKD